MLSVCSFRISCLGLVVVASLTTGCSCFKEFKPGTVKQVAAPGAIVTREAVSVSPAMATDTTPKPYRIGPYDVISINMNGMANISVAGDAGSGAATDTKNGAKGAGATVDAAGIVYLPQVGGVSLAGLTVFEAQEAVRQAYSKYYKNPWVVITVLEHRSKPVYLLGQFKAPGVYYMDRPMTVIEGVALGKGFDPMADLAGARITRKQGVVPIDLHALLSRGQLNVSSQHLLEAGDTIYIPDGRNQQVFVFGSVKKPGPVAIPPSGINLSQAIASVELADLGHDFKHIRVIRSLSATQGELLVVDFDKIMRGQALPMMLQPGDVVYVPRSAVGDWNTAIAEMIPSLQAISTLLQPFVNIKYLKDN